MAIPCARAPAARVATLRGEVRHREGCRARASRAPVSNTSSADADAPPAAGRSTPPKASQLPRDHGRRRQGDPGHSAAALQRLVWTDGAPPPKRAALIAPPDSPQLPPLHDGRSVVVVEGAADVAVVHQAVRAPVLSLGGTFSAYSAPAGRFIGKVARHVDSVVLLLDPDRDGANCRVHLATLLGSRAVHAFCAFDEAVAHDPAAHHAVGSVGIENASPAHVRQRLQQPQKPGSPECGDISTADLQAWGLLSSWQASAKDHSALRRGLLCSAMGLGPVTGKRLAAQLNTFGFTRAQVVAALQQLEPAFPLTCKLMEMLFEANARRSKSLDFVVVVALLKRLVRLAIQSGKVEATTASLGPHLVHLVHGLGFERVPDDALELLLELYGPVAEQAGIEAAVARTWSAKRR